MPAANTAVAFGALIAGAVVIDYGAKALSGSVAAAQTSAPAKTGSKGGATTPTGPGGLTNPFPGGWTGSRLDAGYDGTFKGSLVAPGSGTIVAATNSFSNWGGWIQIKLDHALPGMPSDELYFAEGVAPTVHVGQRVTAGQQIGVPSAANGASQNVGAGTIEWGLATPGGTMGSPTNPLATSVSNPATMVLAFAHTVERLFGIGPPSSTSHAGYE